MIGSEKVDAVWKTVDKQQQFWQKMCQNIMGEGGKKVKWEKIRKPKNIWYQQSMKSVQIFIQFFRLQILLHTKKNFNFHAKNGSEIHKFRSLAFFRRAAENW